MLGRMPERLNETAGGQAHNMPAMLFCSSSSSASSSLSSSVLTDNYDSCKYEFQANIAYKACLYAIES